MKKIGFVMPWFGMKITGGAEAEARELSLKLKETGLEVEFLTTCVKDFSSDWNVNYYKEGTYEEEKITIRRFSVDKRDSSVFDSINLRLMRGERIDSESERLFIQNMINSQNLYSYMKKNYDEYQVFIAIPYMFGTTYYTARLFPEKTVLIPCFHDESYFYMSIFSETFSKVAGIIYNAGPEQELVHKNYQLSENTHELVMGIGMDTDINGNSERFRNKYKITEPFILYAGRKDAGKNVDVLLQYFSEYKKRNESNLQLVLIGGGQIEIPADIKSAVHDLGFVDLQDKYDAYAAAEVLCQPSTHESFSLVIMESWLMNRPVLVHEKCEVTKNFVKQANGGLYFGNYFEYEGCLKYLLDNKDAAEDMGSEGKRFVIHNFSWKAILEKYHTFFKIIEN